MVRYTTIYSNIHLFDMYTQIYCPKSSVNTVGGRLTLYIPYGSYYITPYPHIYIFLDDIEIKRTFGSKGDSQ